MFQNRFIGEETVVDTKETQVLTDKPTWIIDPIDGTVNYINRNPNTCISVALVICKELVIGIIYNPIVSELYTAIKGQGAFLNDKPIKTTCNTGNNNMKKDFPIYKSSFSIFFSFCMTIDIITNLDSNNYYSYERVYE